MKISNYSFGNININNKIYKSDLLIINNQIYPDWRRKNGHKLRMNDIVLIIDNQPTTIFIGTGKFGFLKVPKDLIKSLNSLGFKDIVIEKSTKIIELYNNCQNERKALAIHLTC